MLNYNCAIIHILAKQLSHVIISIMIVANRAVIADKGLVLLKMLDSPKNTSNICLGDATVFYGIPGGPCIMSKHQQNLCEI